MLHIGHTEERLIFICSSVTLFLFHVSWTFSELWPSSKNNTLENANKIIITVEPNWASRLFFPPTVCVCAPSKTTLVCTTNVLQIPKNASNDLWMQELGQKRPVQCESYSEDTALLGYETRNKTCSDQNGGFSDKDHLGTQSSAF